MNVALNSLASSYANSASSQNKGHKPSMLQGLEKNKDGFVKSNSDVSFTGLNAKALRSGVEVLADGAKKLKKPLEKVLKSITGNASELPMAKAAKVAESALDQELAKKAAEILKDPAASQAAKNAAEKAIQYAAQTMNLNTGHLTSVAQRALDNATKSPSFMGGVAKAAESIFRIIFRC